MFQQARKWLILMVITLVLGSGFFAPQSSDATIALSNLGGSASILEWGPITDTDTPSMVFTVPAGHRHQLKSIAVSLHCFSVSCVSPLSVTVHEFTPGRFPIGEPKATVSMLILANGIITFNSFIDQNTGKPFVFEGGKSYKVLLHTTSPSDIFGWYLYNTTPTGVFQYTGSYGSSGASIPNEHFGITINTAVIPGIPTLNSPVNKAHTTDTTPTFTWNATQGAVAYRIRIYLDDGTVIEQKVVNGTSFTLNTPLAKGQKYLWRVRAKSVDNLWGAWSSRNILFVD